MAIQNLVWGAAQPFAGALADRFGIAKVLSTGAILYAAGIFFMAYSKTGLELHLTAGFLIGFGLAGASFALVLAALGQKMPPEKRSMALGLATAASSFGQFLIVPVAGFLISTFEWQTALIILSAVPLAIIPLSFVMAGGSETPATGPQQSIGGAIREASRHSGYWLLVSGFFVCGFHVAFIQVHLPPHIIDNNMAPEVGAWALALVGLLNVFGSFVAGMMGGRYSKKYLLSWLYLARSVFIAIYVVLPPTVASTLIFASAMGLLWLSTVPLTSGLVAQIFGPRYMGMLFGFVFFSHQVGAFLGVWLGGRIYDETQSYEIVWWIAVGPRRLRRPRPFPDQRQASRAAGASDVKRGSSFRV